MHIYNIYIYIYIYVCINTRTLRTDNTFNVIISYTFLDGFIEIRHIQNVWRFSCSILTIVVNFWIFFEISVLKHKTKKTNGVSI